MSVAVLPERDIVASDTGSLPSEMGGRGSMKTLGRLLIELAVWGICSYLLLESTRGLLRALDPMHGEKQAAAKVRSLGYHWVASCLGRICPVREV